MQRPASTNKDGLCPVCKGAQTVLIRIVEKDGKVEKYRKRPCPQCGGTGKRGYRTKG